MSVFPLGPAAPAGRTLSAADPPEFTMPNTAWSPKGGTQPWPGQLGLVRRKRDVPVVFDSIAGIAGVPAESAA